MRILFDHQIFTYQKYGGISKYHYELLKEIPNDYIELPLALKYNVNEYLKSLVEKYDFKTFNINNKFIKLALIKLNQYFSVKKLKQNDFDIFHPTFYDDYFLKYLKKPFIITIHDMTPELYHEYLINSLYSHLVTARWIKAKEKLARKAEKIIVISENTRKDVISYYNLPPEKVVTIYHGYNVLTVSPKPCSNLIPEPYLLYVGLRNGYKNFQNFVKAVIPVLSENKTLKIMCVGGGSFTDNEQKLLNTHDVMDRFSQLNLTDKELCSAYTYAEAFIFPSLYEGFGMPILEAFSCGCPVILSNTSCFPEIGGDAAVYFDPSDIDSMTAVIKKTIYDSGRLGFMKDKGLERCKLFNWSETAQQTFQVYKNILNI